MLEAVNVHKTYTVRGHNGSQNIVHAVNGVDLSLKKGELCALVGESGSGKSTLSQLLMGLIPPTSGEVLLDGKSIVPKGRRRDKNLCSKLQIVLQDGKSALDPHYTVYQSIAEPIRNLMKLSRDEEKRRVLAWMEQMELPKYFLKRRPQELSGGQQKRVCIARALAVEPSIVIFDEAVSGLDVLVRKNILDLLKQLHRRHNTTYLFITHDIDVALYLANRIFVMKAGKIVEQVQYSGVIGIFTHPYSRMLLRSMVPDTSNTQNGYTRREAR